jgi:hypothetical protein
MLEVLSNSLGRLDGPDDYRERRTATIAAEALARSPTGDPANLFITLMWKFQGAMEDADIDTARDVLAEIEQLATSTGLAQRRWFAVAARTLLHVLAADLDTAESLAVEAFQLGTTIGHSAASSTFGAHLTAIRIMQGRGEEVLPLFEQMVDQLTTIPAFTPALANLLRVVGRTDDMRRLFEDAASRGFEGYPRDLSWLGLMGQWADCAADLTDVDAARVLIPQLRPFSGRIIVQLLMCLGSIDRPLGRLYATIGDHESAARSLRQALASHEQLAAPFFVARTELDLADLLTTRQGPGDQAEAERLRGEAHRLITLHGFGALTRT